MEIVLLPGLDGTGDLLVDFVSALPPNLKTQIVRYPIDRVLSYEQLFSLVADAAPRTEPFVLLAESFSSPLAVRLAATNPPNLRGLIICAGFIKNPIPGWLLHLKALVKPVLFRFPLPSFVLEHFLIGAQAPRSLRDAVGRTLRSVCPAVIASRVRDVMTCDATTEFARVRVPTLYLLAGQDRLVNKSSYREFKQLNKDTALVSIPAPHFLLQREPETAATVISRFVESLQS